MENKYFILNKVEEFSSEYVIKKKITVFQTKPWWWFSYEISQNHATEYKQIIFLKRKWIGTNGKWVKCNTKYNTERMQWEDIKK